MSTRRAWLRIDLLLVITVLALTAPFLRDWSAQPASRYLYTVALAEDHTFRLDAYRESLGMDYAVIDGHVYSDKAPYQPILVVPVYWAFRAAGGEAFPAGQPGQEIGHRVDISLWLMTLFSSAIPAAILVVLVRRHVARRYPEQSVKVALALLCATVMLPFSALLFGHVLSAAVAFGAWFILRRDGPSAVALVGAGLLMGIGPGIEYPQILVAAVLGVYSLVAYRWRAAWVALGGLLGLVPLFVVNATTFGGPFTTAYQGYLPNFQGSGAFGVYNLVLPVPRELFLALVGDRGLFSLTSVMLLAVVGALALLRGHRKVRPEAIVALVLLVLFLLISTGIDGYGGSSSGPRYLIPIIPFFAVPLAEAWRRWPPVTTVAALLSATAMILATLTDPLYQDGGPAIVDWANRFFTGRFEHSLPGSVLGDPAVLLAVVAAIVAATFALVQARSLTSTSRSRSSPPEEHSVPVAPGG